VGEQTEGEGRWRDEAREEERRSERREGRELATGKRKATIGTMREGARTFWNIKISEHRQIKETPIGFG
jgi:hypothetical protein